MLRGSLHTFLAVFTVASVLIGCKPADKAAPATPEGAMPMQAATAEPPEFRAGWRADEGYSTPMLMHVSDAGESVALSCMSVRPVLRVSARDFTRADGARFALELDGQTVALEEQPPMGPGVQASAPLGADLLDRLAAARTITLRYGGQAAGPVAAPDKTLFDPFIARCRELAGNAS